MASTAPIDLSPALARALNSIASDADLGKEAEQAYVAFLGFYNSNLKHSFGDKASLVAEANALFVGAPADGAIGLPKVPIIPKDTVSVARYCYSHVSRHSWSCA